ncbi:MAG TPA: 50S ribosomal protein L10 [Thermoanaerobaculia bacterium]|nr:50S ribosomal protein L10 [Thermoanaerobaculia bacterium]
MPLTPSEKQNLVEEYRSGLAVAPHAFILGFQGVSVPQVTELRAKVRETGAHYIVVKNRLVRRAIEDAALAALGEHFQGPTAIAYCDEDPVALAKVLADFAKDVPVMSFKAGLVEGRAVAGSEITEIAKLPSREELIAKLLYLLQSPITRFARVLAALPRQFVTVLDQVRQEKEKTT